MCVCVCVCVGGGGGGRGGESCIKKKEKKKTRDSIRLKDYDLCILISFISSSMRPQLCLSLSEVPSNFAKDSRLTNSAQEVMVSDVLLKLLTFS